MLGTEKILVVQLAGSILKRLRLREPGQLTQIVWLLKTWAEAQGPRLTSRLLFSVLPYGLPFDLLQPEGSLYVQFKMNIGDHLFIVKGPQHRVNSFPVNPHSFSCHIFGEVH